MLRRALILIVVLLLSALRIDSAHAAGPDEYRQALTAALAEVERGDAAAITRAAVRLRAVDSVLLPDGRSIGVDNRAILAALEAQPPDRAAAQERLRALLSSVTRSRGLFSSTQSDDVERRLRSILGRPEFQPEPPPDPVTAFLDDLRTRFFNWLARQLGGLLTSRVSEGVQGQLLAIVGLVFVVALVVWVARTLRRTVGPGATGRMKDSEASRLTSETARAEAERLAREGAFRDAIRALWLATLLSLEEAGKLRFDRALTNREVLALVGGSGDPRFVERLRPLVDRFDRFWYSGAPGSAEEYAGFGGLVAQSWEVA